MTLELHPWAADLQELQAQVWTRLVRGVRDRRAPSRHPTLATVSPEGKPEARTVVLRCAFGWRAGQVKLRLDEPAPVGSADEARHAREGRAIFPKGGNSASGHAPIT